MYEVEEEDVGFHEAGLDAPFFDTVVVKRPFLHLASSKVVVGDDPSVPDQLSVVCSQHLFHLSMVHGVDASSVDERAVVVLRTVSAPGQVMFRCSVADAAMVVDEVAEFHGDYE